MVKRGQKGSMSEKKRILEMKRKGKLVGKLLGLISPINTRVEQRK